MIFRLFVILILIVFAQSANAATILPQLEKIPDIIADVNRVDARLANNNNIEKTELQPRWENAAYNFVASSLGLYLPHPSDPDNRDESEYVKANQGWCDEVVAGNPENASRMCKHVIAIARSTYAGFQFEDLFAVHYMNGNGWQALNINDVFHERAQACSDIQSQINIIWGSGFNFDLPGHQYDKMIRDGFIGKRMQQLKYKLNSNYREAIRDHIENNIYVEFYGDHETKYTHPNGVNCDLY